MKQIECVVIPARGGSKRIKRKNLKEFLGISLLERSIHFAQQITQNVIVSSDDDEILEKSLQLGAYPFVRSQELANDFTPTLPVVANVLYQFLDAQALQQLHTLQQQDSWNLTSKQHSTIFTHSNLTHSCNHSAFKQESFCQQQKNSEYIQDSKPLSHQETIAQNQAIQTDSIKQNTPTNQDCKPCSNLILHLQSPILCLYPTAVFATKEHITQSLTKLFSQNDIAYIVAVLQNAKVLRSFSINTDGFLQFLFPQFMQTRSQDLMQTFNDAGQFYLGFAQSFLCGIPILGEKSMGIELEYAWDIDTMQDFEIAENLFKLMEHKKGDV